MAIEDVIEDNDKVENLRAFERRRLIGLNGSRGNFALRLKIPNQISTADYICTFKSPRLEAK